MSELKPPSFVSAQMVADRAGVSRSAVSRTFTDGASVSEATRRKVLEAADALGYHVNHLARGLRERSNIVCLVVADMTTPIRARMVDVLTRKLQASGKITMVINTETDTESVSAALRQTLNYRADATVVLSGTPPASLIETCISNGQQVILINRDERLQGSSSLGVDNAMAGREALFLLRRAGCERLGLITSNARTASLVEREAVFVEAAAAEGLQVVVTEAGPTSYESGQEAARRVFGRSEAPDGVFCVTDLLALGFMDVARRDFGLAIPDDLCVVGFDDIEQAGWASYQLTTFRQPLNPMADEVVDLLLQPQRAVSERRMIEPIPVWRRSVRPGKR
ncbi:DNA-binding LacI/PurR family transcriptional regulator [Devosia subaequoris]|uniref:DNA-binding LacI/PurR family transcriptional regulator n=1 Tax=Devosia subaequoris TaxID=395930 RepID=A0A7W6IKB9_9HYPH|nr:substrate-binding domain-containing protein [Devosia subaequoris]MBB4051173.1 DNA-binding LacI/PurR family transcriptional regulator [Devosia subaequoris]MCP1208163.1 substrate-binding domain-containing protein [Devosia subaequoris]